MPAIILMEIHLIKAKIVCPPKNIRCVRAHDFTATWIAKAPEEHTFEHVCNARYFGQSAKGLRVNDFIRVFPADSSWVAELIVTAVVDSMSEVHTRVFQHVDLAVKTLPNGWEIKHLGSEGGHAIYYQEDMKEKGFKSPEQAQLRIKALAANMEPVPDVPVSVEPTDERPALEAEADSLGVSYRSDISDAGLKKKIEAAKLEQV